MLNKHQTLRVRILVKAFPQPSKAHEETVCCAGITDDGKQLLRLFPIRFRRLPKEHQFDRFDLVEMIVTKASDPRPESFRVDEASIRLVERDNLTNENKVRLWQPFIAPSLTQLHEDNRSTNRSYSDVSSRRFRRCRIVTNTIRTKMVNAKPISQGASSL
jgi:hypothetical protein